MYRLLSSDYVSQKYCLGVGPDLRARSNRHNLIRKAVPHVRVGCVFRVAGGVAVAFPICQLRL